MNSKTPRFKELLKEVNDKITGSYSGVCAESGEKYEYTPEQVEMYKKLEVPVPSVSSQTINKRQRVFIPGLELFKRDLATGQKGSISMYDPESPAIVWDNMDWYSDKFDGLEYGKPVDSNLPILEQWKDFAFSVPRICISNDTRNINSPWVVNASRCRNCYFNHGGINNESMIYSDFCADCKFAVDSVGSVNSEWLYNCVQCDSSSKLFSCERCGGGLNLYFCLGCRNCSDCFGCTNLSRKKHCFFNEQLTEKQYNQKMSEIDLGEREVYVKYKKKAEEMWGKAVKCSFRQYNCEDVIGDDIADSTNSITNFAIRIQDSYNIFDASAIKNCCDITTANNLERCYNCTSMEECYECRVCIVCSGSNNIEYCEYCYDCEYCFGCIALRHKKYCIFNVQYTEEEYWKKLDEIKYNMLKRGEYGQYFPYNTSLFSYNTSGAMFFDPLDKEQIEKLGARWYDLKKSNEIDPSIEISIIPENIKDADESILKQMFKCPESNRTFRIIKPEFDFYKEFKVALPINHPNVRRQKNITKFMPIYLEKFTCNKCQKESQKQKKIKDNGKLFCDVCYEEHLITNADLHV